MKNVILVGLLAVGLVGCGAKEEAAVEADPAAEVAAEAPAADHQHHAAGAAVEEAPTTEVPAEGLSATAETLAAQ